MTAAFSIRDLVKTYSEFQLGPLNLDVEPGTVLGYIGPNGSGKTTTMYCLTGLVKPDHGEVEICGWRQDRNRPEWKEAIGYVGDQQVFHENWSGERNLAFLSQFYAGWSNPRAAELDPIVRSELLEVLFEFMSDGERAILYSTHILADISRLANELAFLDDGKIKARQATDDLADQWRRISFRSAGDLKLTAVASHRYEGRDHQVVSFNREITLRQLGELGAENIQEQRMGIDEIAVQILKGGGNVANSEN